MLNSTKWGMRWYIKHIFIFMILSQRASTLIIGSFLLIFLLEYDVIELELFFARDVVHVLDVLDIPKHVKFLLKIWIFWELWILLEYDLIHSRSSLSWCSRRNESLRISFVEKVNIWICFKIISVIYDCNSLFILGKDNCFLIHYLTENICLSFERVCDAGINFLFLMDLRIAFGLLD